MPSPTSSSTSTTGNWWTQPIQTVWYGPPTSPSGIEPTASPDPSVITFPAGYDAAWSGHDAAWERLLALRPAIDFFSTNYGPIIPIAPEPWEMDCGCTRFGKCLVHDPK